MNIAQNKSDTPVRYRTAEARLLARLALVGTAGVTAFVVAVVVLHVLRPEYDPVRRVISNYAVGQYGVLMTIGFLALAISQFALAAGLYRGMAPSSRSRIAMILLGIAGMGVLLAAIFPTDVTPNDAPVTPTGVIHILASIIGFLCLLAAMFLLSRRFKQDLRWQSFSRPSFALALAALAAFLAFFAIQATATPIGGIAQRMLVGLYLVWLFLTAIRLRSIAKGL